MPAIAARRCTTAGPRPCSASSRSCSVSCPSIHPPPAPGLAGGQRHRPCESRTQLRPRAMTGPSMAALPSADEPRASARAQGQRTKKPCGIWGSRRSVSVQPSFAASVLFENPCCATILRALALSTRYLPARERHSARTSARAEARSSSL